jgi:PAS domain S-box-containing protein
MQQNQRFSLEQAIEPNPLIVTLDTPLVEVIQLMSQRWVRSCHPEKNDSTTDEKEATLARTSYALVIEDSQVIGIFTERDLVRLTASGRLPQETTIAEVMSQEVVTLKASEVEDVFSVLSLMSERNIRHLPILNERNQLLGVITPEGMRRALHPTEWLRFRRVEEVMNTQIIHAPPTVSVLDVIKLMVEHHVSCIVIVEKDEDSPTLVLFPIGIITERDVLQFQKSKLDLERTLVHMVMSKPLFSVSAEDSLWAVHQTMQQYRVRRLIVTGKQGELQGIITETSLLQALDPTEMYGLLELLHQKVEQLEVERSELSQSYIKQSQLYQQVQTALEERKQVEKALRQERNLISAILNVAGALIVVLDKQGKVVSFNQTCERITGYSFEEMENREFWDLIPPEEIKRTREVFEELKQGKFPNQHENHWIGKDGFRHLIAWSNTCLIDDDGSVKYIVASGIDLTEKKQLEAQFLRAQRLESIGTLSGGIAHDLNNILTPILAISQLLPLKLPQADEQTRHFFDILQTSAQRGANLVKQVLSFARGVQGERTPLQVKHIISEIREFARNTFPKSIEIQVDFPNDLRMIRGDATQIHQALMNLCVNARDAMPNGGKLSITAENIDIDENYVRMNLDGSVGGYILITVADTGIGIPPEILERIFEPFFTTKEQSQGTGLGLSTTIGIVKSHGGFMKVYTEVGKGSKFQVYLPAAQTTAIVENELGEILKGKGELILVVDDEMSIREITKTSLESNNYQVLIASDGIEAIALYAQHYNEISAVLMDMIMPEMDSVTVLRTLQRINPQVKIIAVSGLTTSDKVSVAISNGAKLFLSKPYTCKELLNALYQVINLT